MDARNDGAREDAAAHDPAARQAAVHDLLSGPRGRFLCQALAARLSPDVSEALRFSANQFDSGRGTGRAVDNAALIGNWSGPRPDPVVVSVPQFAALIRAAGEPEPTASEIEESLRDSVDYARYWQPPDGEDVLAGQPEVRAALEPVAQAVLSSDAASDWASAAGSTQWRIAWENSRPRGLPTAHLLQEWADATRADERRSRVDRPVDPRAANSGEWWSAPLEVPSTCGAIPRGFDLVEDSDGPEVATARSLEIDGHRILEIRTAENWAELCRAHPLEVTASRRHDWFRTTGRNGAWVIPDWQAVAGEWDAVHLSIAAYLSLAGRAIEVDGERASVIAGWNPDSTFWLTEPPTSDARPQFWHRAEPQAPWSRRV